MRGETMQIDLYAGAYGLRAEDEQAALAFTAFVAQHAQFAYRLALARLRNASDAEDAVQETFLKLYQQGGWKTAENERAYLARSVWRMASTVAARGRRQTAEDLAEHETASLSPGPEQQLLDGDAEARVHRLIDALPEKLRLPLVLSSIDGLESAEVAGLLHIPAGTVRRRVMQARALLREKLAVMESRHAR